jgi:peroxiredoxin
MKKRFLISLLLLTGLLSALPCHTVHGSQDEPLQVGSQLPNFTLPAPDSQEASSYLGLKKTMAPCTISQIDAKLVLVEFLSVLCPGCHSNAPVVNRLYQAIQKDAVLARDVKVIGICIGNDNAQRNAFKKNRKVKFPLFTDEDSTTFQAVGMISTPTMVLVTPGGKVLMSHIGRIQDFDGFLKNVRENHEKL